eukprot:22338-Chlamydomonas_euryale.AAC.1
MDFGSTCNCNALAARQRSASLTRREAPAITSIAITIRTRSAHDPHTITRRALQNLQKSAESKARDR